MANPKRRLTALEREALKKKVARTDYLQNKYTANRPRQAPKAPTNKPTVYRKPPSAPKPPGYGKTPPKPPAGTGKGMMRTARTAKPGRRGSYTTPNTNRMMRTKPPAGMARASRASGKLASKALARATAGVVLGGALLAHDVYKAIDAYSKTSGPKKQMAKYKAKGGFSHMTSNPNKRGKEGVDY